MRIWTTSPTLRGGCILFLSLAGSSGLPPTTDVMNGAEPQPQHAKVSTASSVVGETGVFVTEGDRTLYSSAPITASRPLTYTVDYQNARAVAGGGGNGGQPIAINCPMHYIASGLVGRAGQTIDRIGLQCRPLNANGALGAPYLTGAAGGQGGKAFGVYCPSGQAMQWLTGRSGWYVDQLRIHCGSITGTAAYDSASVGGSGGTPFAAKCPAGFDVTGIYGRAGLRIDQVNITCTRIATSTLPASPTGATYKLDYATSLDVTGAGLPQSPVGWLAIRTNCDRNYVATGLVGRAGDRIDQLGLQCQQLKSDGTTASPYVTDIKGYLITAPQFKMYCPPGQAIQSLRGRAGLEVDQLGFRCVSIAGTGSFDSPGVGGSGGTPFAAACPNEYVMTGIWGQHGQAWNYAAPAMGLPIILSYANINMVCTKIVKTAAK